MEKFGKSQPVTRREDLRLLTGAGRYTDDTVPEGALYGVFLRAPVAHGRLTALDIEEAQQAPGVRLVLTAEDLRAAGVTEGLFTVMVKNRDGSPGIAPRRPILAEGRVRFVGEPMALVVAETLDAAKDAAELIMPEIEDLPVHLEMAPGGEPLHAEAPDNRAFTFGLGDEEAVSAAFQRAEHVVDLEVEDNKIIANALEGRACTASWDGARLSFDMSSQGVWTHKSQLAKVLGLAEDAVHVTTGDVGGGFGMKTMVYPEYFVVAQAARMLGATVRWAAERGEGMLSDNMGRDLVSRGQLAFDADHRIIGYRVDTRFNLGAYASQFGPLMQTQLFSRVMTGVYDVPAAYLQSEAFFTNTCQVDAYRGAGRPEAIYVLERMMDRAARELGVSPWELRRRNFIPVEAFPYKTVPGETYDVGDFARVLAHAETAADLPGYDARRAASEAKGRLRGQGLACYIEAILGAPDEGVRVEFEEAGAVIYVGTQSNGQGHETVYAQFLSDQSGIPVEKIRVVQGDSDLIARGGGTGGSRSVTVQANVTLKAVSDIVNAFSGFLAREFDVPEDQVSFDDERFRIPGSNETPGLLEVAEMARAKGETALLSFSAHEALEARSFPNGCHVVEVEIDPDTGEVEIDRYQVVDDFGNLINPLLVEGQVHGGIAQGAGQALMERVVYDETGQLLTASFMDYAMPRATDLPFFRFETEPVPSTANPMGMKGCGEAGTVGALAAVSNAVQDALWERGVRQADMPFTPHRVWQMLRTEAAAQAAE
ncbi:xanthine dehydrogenase family protein molybdopterin-binding subunit [Roseivivax sp. GX 12232]|uniref:xanthine dehydrogenase family protein molybdopterin-binding subunit n=1 Tax=Roseivivax sp. GX 12232 TaxID=2900547 RepID=UPI001E34E40F|nr:xanthine dehydrogenase family protein molybdopterin-binding subunit [Roseivivax sp. GX 12232]MCE0504304.1 xanthine dehydrogenase family protein molybdopterin-binding subunit [Roseivivax sp. GX 12232]